MKPIYFIITLLLLVSCNGNFNTFEEVPDKNKKRLEDFLKIEITDDIRNTWAYGDMMGIDASFQFSFDCDTNTLKRIIEANQMTLKEDKSLFISIGIDHYKYFPKDHLENLNEYEWRREDNRYVKRLWYDYKDNRAYFLDYDL